VVCVLQNILHNHDENDAGHEVITTAMESMVDVAKHINELKRQHERHARREELQGSFARGSGMDIVGFGELILEVPTSFPIYNNNNNNIADNI